MNHFIPILHPFILKIADKVILTFALFKRVIVTILPEN